VRPAQIIFHRQLKQTQKNAGIAALPGEHLRHAKFLRMRNPQTCIKPWAEARADERFLRSSIYIFITSKRVAKGETNLLCQKKKQLNARAKMSAKANRPALRRASLCARKWNIFGKANTAHVRRSRRLLSASRRRGGRE
jgi:hypothetical protein